MKLGNILGLLGGFGGLGLMQGLAGSGKHGGGFNPLNMLFGASGMAMQPFGGGNGLSSLFGGGQGGGDDISVTGLPNQGPGAFDQGGANMQPMNFLGSLSNPQNMRGGGMPGLTQLTGLGQGMRY